MLRCGFITGMGIVVLAAFSTNSHHITRQRAPPARPPSGSRSHSVHFRYIVLYLISSYCTRSVHICLQYDTPHVPYSILYFVRLLVRVLRFAVPPTKVGFDFFPSHVSIHLNVKAYSDSFSFAFGSLSCIICVDN